MISNRALEDFRNSYEGKYSYEYLPRDYALMFLAWLNKLVKCPRAKANSENYVHRECSICHSKPRIPRYQVYEE